jgi:citrate synthase
MSLEQVAALLCDVPHVICPIRRSPIDGKTPFARAMKALALDAETAVPMQGRTGEDIAQEAGRMISLVVEACLGKSSKGSIHERVGSEWGLDDKAQGVLRRALVLLSDHELNPSTFAVRVCASTGGSLPAALLSGIATLSGPKHGGVASLTNDALQAALQGNFDAFLSVNAKMDTYAYGFGHPLYPDGDPRAKHLLSQIPSDSLALTAASAVSERIRCVPNIDMALAVFADQYGCPQDAATTIFSIGRVAGWVAHAIEQVQSGTMIRPRAKYETSPKNW